MKKSRNNGRLHVMMTGEMSLDDWDEKSEKKNDQYGVDGTREEDYSGDKEMHNVISDL